MNKDINNRVLRDLVAEAKAEVLDEIEENGEVEEEESPDPLSVSRQLYFCNPL